jgi:hypothetical protein
MAMLHNQPPLSVANSIQRTKGDAMKTTQPVAGNADAQTDAETLANQHKPAADPASGEVVSGAVDVADVLTGVTGVAIDILGSIFD